MRIELTDQELDYVGKLLLQRPMGEVEPLVVNIRMQISKQKVGGNGVSQSPAPSGTSDEDEDDGSFKPA